MSSQTSSALTYLRLAAAVLAWGGTFVAAKFAVADTSVEMAALLRFVFAGLVLLVILRLQLGYLPKLNLVQSFYVLMLGLTGVAAYNLFFFFGLQTVEAGRGALIITSNPLLVALGSAWFLGQRFSLLNLTGLLLCVTGVSIVLSRGAPLALLSEGVGGGELALLGCAASWAAYTLFGKKLMLSKAPLEPLALVTYSCISGSMMLALWMLIDGKTPDIESTVSLWLALAYLALLGTVAGFVWYFQGVRDIGPARASVFVFFVPVSALILGAIILGEPITLSLLLGAALILGGVALVNRVPKLNPGQAL